MGILSWLQRAVHRHYSTELLDAHCPFLLRYLLGAYSPRCNSSLKFLQVRFLSLAGFRYYNNNKGAAVDINEISHMRLTVSLII